MDVLADVFATLRIGGMIYAQNDLVAPWGLAFDRTSKAGFHAVVRGHCWLRTAQRKPLELHAGDVVLLPHRWTHSLSDRPDGPARPYATPIPRRGTGPTTTLICGAYSLAPEANHHLLALLPPVIHVRGDAAPPEIAETVRRLSVEAARPQPGSAAASARLSDLLLLYILRAWLATQHEGRGGWLGALRDPSIARVLSRFHERPEASWVLAAMAPEIGVSRATLVRRFTALVGMPPLTYLTHWRMALAGRLLRETGDGIAEIAGRVGYASEFAFNRAFKRAYGCPPGAYRKRGGPAARALAA
jgi:AraC-like DNA-binding protein